MNELRVVVLVFAALGCYRELARIDQIASLFGLVLVALFTFLFSRVFGFD